MEAHIDISQLKKVIHDFELRGRGIGGVMPAIAEILVEEVDTVFEVSGPGWEPLKPSTLLKRRASTDPKPMIDTANLRGSVHGEHGSDFAEAATNVPYVVFHLEGGPVIPQRNPFEIDEDHAYAQITELLVAEVAS